MCVCFNIWFCFALNNLIVSLWFVVSRIMNLLFIHFCCCCYLSFLSIRSEQKKWNINVSTIYCSSFFYDYYTGINVSVYGAKMVERLIIHEGGDNNKFGIVFHTNDVRLCHPHSHRCFSGGRGDGEGRALTGELHPSVL